MATHPETRRLFPQIGRYCVERRFGGDFEILPHITEGGTSFDEVFVDDVSGCYHRNAREHRIDINEQNGAVRRKSHFINVSSARWMEFLMQCGGENDVIF